MDFYEEDLISQVVRTTGSFEPDIYRMIQLQLKTSPDAILVDIGANVGVMTSAALSLGRKAIAVEALPKNARSSLVQRQRSGPNTPAESI